MICYFGSISCRRWLTALSWVCNQFCCCCKRSFWSGSGASERLIPKPPPKRANPRPLPLQAVPLPQGPIPLPIGPVPVGPDPSNAGIVTPFKLFHRRPLLFTCRRPNKRPTVDSQSPLFCRYGRLSVLGVFGICLLLSPADSQFPIARPVRDP